jgi:long-chain acyl-CoA synthetase
MSNLWDLSQIQPRTDLVVPGDTISAMFWNAVEQRGPNVWMRQKELGIWRSWTWQQTAEAVREIAGGLMSLGFKPQETASILSNTVIEWVLADLAVLSCGGVSNGIYPTDAASQVHYLCEDSRTTVLFVEDDEQLDKALEVREQLPMLRKIVVFDMEGLHKLDDPGVISLAKLRELGREFNALHADALMQRVKACKPEDLAILVYTSGTTGKPKGAMHTHGGLVYTVRGYNTLIARTEADECMCFLPLVPHRRAHGRRVLLALHRRQAQLCGKPRDRARERARDRAHRVHGGSAGLGEVLFRGDDHAQGSQPPAARHLCLGHRRGQADRRPGAGRPDRQRWLKAQFTLARWLALNNVRKLIGIHRARFLVTGAAPISPELVVVPGAGRAHAGSVGHDRDLRRLHRRAGCAHQARLDRPGRGVQRSEDRSGHGRDPGARPQRVCRLPEPARRKPPKPSTPTAGCTPAMSG